MITLLVLLGPQRSTKKVNKRRANHPSCHLRYCPWAAPCACVASLPPQEETEAACHRRFYAWVLLGTRSSVGWAAASSLHGRAFATVTDYCKHTGLYSARTCQRACYTAVGRLCRPLLGAARLGTGGALLAVADQQHMQVILQFICIRQKGQVAATVVGKRGHNKVAWLLIIARGAKRVYEECVGCDSPRRHPAPHLAQARSSGHKPEKHVKSVRWNVKRQEALADEAISRAALPQTSKAGCSWQLPSGRAE